LIYKNWNGIDLTEQIAIWAGKYGYERKITWNTNDSSVCGLVTLHNDKNPIYDIENQKYKTLATHSAQSENHDILGMAIMVPKANFGGYGKRQTKKKVMM
jgi:hypothetical protein